jgi:DNA-directed RNA polymerase I, II, and III subunit RPABC3
MKAEERKLFEDIFIVKAMDPGNKTPFKNVSRVHMQSEYQLKVELDINTQIYPVAVDNRFFIKVNAADSGTNVYSPDELSKSTEKDNYEYVMYGTVFQIDERDGDLIIFASFGGLIMKLSGKRNFLSSFRKEGLEAKIFLLMRKA